MSTSYISIIYAVIICLCAPCLWQLNEKRATDRRPPEPMQRVNQPFDGSKFNFNKVKPAEVLFNLKNESRRGSTTDQIIINVRRLHAVSVYTYVCITHVGYTYIYILCMYMYVYDVCICTHCHLRYCVPNYLIL